MAHTWGSIIDALGGTGKVAASLVLADNTVSGWRERGIPSAHWVALCRLAASEGQKQITLEVLAALVARDPAALAAEATA